MYLSKFRLAIDSDLLPKSESMFATFERLKTLLCFIDANCQLDCFGREPFANHPQSGLNTA